MDEYKFRSSMHGYNRDDVNAFIVELDRADSAEKEALDERIREKDVEITNLKYKLSAIEEKLSEAERANAEADAALESKLSQLAAEKDARIAECEATITAQQEKINALEMRVSLLESTASSRNGRACDDAATAKAIEDANEVRRSTQIIIDYKINEANEFVRCLTDEGSERVRDCCARIVSEIASIVELRLAELGEANAAAAANAVTIPLLNSDI